jgi:C-terminal processing protease CtpA/Prc
LKQKSVVHQIGPFAVSHRTSDCGLQITEILPNGPVHRAGKLRVGDVLKTVDGKLVGEAGTSVKDLLSGPHGTTVALTVLRQRYDREWKGTILAATMSISRRCPSPLL